MGYDHLIEMLRFFEKPPKGKARKTVRRRPAAKTKAAKKKKR
jgi:hypothetical protein